MKSYNKLGTSETINITRHDWAELVTDGEKLVCIDPKTLEILTAFGEKAALQKCNGIAEFSAVVRCKADNDDQFKGIQASELVGEMLYSFGLGDLLLD